MKSDNKCKFSVLSIHVAIYICITVDLTKYSDILTCCYVEERKKAKMAFVFNCFEKLGNSLEKRTKEQSLGYRAVRAIRDGEHQKLRQMLCWECGGVRYKVRLKEPIDSDMLSELCIPEHLYRTPDDKDKSGATLLEVAAVLGHSKCVEVLLDLGFQMSYNPIVKGGKVE